MKDTGLTEKEWEQIRAALRAVPAIEKAVLFGSRAMGLARGNSDVDIMLYGDALTMGDVAHARALLEETTLPYQFDLVLCDAENAALQEHVRRYGKVMFEKYEHKRILREQWENAGGCLPATWDITSFGELLLTPKSMSVGVMYPGTHTTDGVPLVKIGDVNDGVIQKPTFCISREVNREYNRTQLDGYELLITLVGNPGECIVVDKSMAGWNVARAIACARISNPDIRYYVKSIIESKPGRNIVDGYLNTTVQKTLNLKELREIPIPLPPQKEIHSLAGFVFKVNSRIQLLRETNATLEAMAQALFKTWFVDFDPVHAKTEGRAPEGMDAEIAALFPDEFEESELGMIPTSWKNGTLAYLASLNPESWTAKNHPDQINYVDLANVKDNIIFNVLSMPFCDAPSRARRILQSGDTIVGTVRPGNRSFAHIRMHSEQLTGSTGFAVLRPKSPMYAEFIYLAATSSKNIEKLAHIADGAAYPAVRPEAVVRLACILPGEVILQAFHKQVFPFFSRIAINHEQIRSLTKLRDTLLPRLISGKLRLPEFAEAVDEATA